MTNEIDETLVKTFLVRPKTKSDLKNWIFVYLGLDLPDSHLDEDGSNASPMEAIWKSFETYSTNTGDEHPGYIWLSARDAMKTLGGSVFAVVAMVFFDATVCWLASIEPQSKIALANAQSFIQKLTPYLSANGKQIESSNARILETISPDGTRAYVNILVATMASVNGRHCNIVMVDELDLLRDPRVIDEVQAVASLIKAQFPLKVYFSTRKFAFGNMEKLISNRERFGLELLKWDILDVTEYCHPRRHQPDLPKTTRFIHPDPPLRSLTQPEYDMLPGVEKAQYREMKVHGGCGNCKLLSQCRMRLASRSPEDTGQLWKKINHTINMFRSMSPDMAVAQLLCRKPSLSGLVYPRFDTVTNSISLQDAYARISGVEGKNATLQDIVKQMHHLGIPFYVGGDWGYAHNTAFVVAALLPNGDFWIVDSTAISGLEFDDILALALNIKDIYKPKMWFMDTAEPMFIKTFRRKGMPCKDFKKDVMGGIEAVRSQVMNSLGIRKLKILKHEKNEHVTMAFQQHHFKIDAQGNPTAEPDDGEYSDILDSLRYLAQNMFGAKGRVIAPNIEMPSAHTPFGSRMTNPNGQVYTDWMSQKIRELAGQNSDTARGKSSSGSVIWDLSDPMEPPDDQT